MKWKDFVCLHSDISPEEEIACILWTRPDVYDKAGEKYPNFTMTDEVADDVLYRMNHSADCENGMTWCVLEYHLDAVLKEFDFIT